jgi:predicted kinase
VMSELIVVRGVSGSGKSTLAKSYGILHVESDMYFMRNGIYDWSGEGLQAAHRWCSETVEYAMKFGLDVVVSNTFCRIWEFANYLELAEQYGYDVKVVVCRNNYGNTHGVPDASLEKMKARWEDYPNEYSYYGE